MAPITRRRALDPGTPTIPFQWKTRKQISRDNYGQKLKRKWFANLARPHQRPRGITNTMARYRSYQNVVHQALMHTSLFINWIQSHKAIQCVAQNCILCSYRDLVNNYWNTPFVPDVPIPQANADIRRIVQTAQADDQAAFGFGNQLGDAGKFFTWVEGRLRNDVQLGHVDHLNWNRELDALFKVNWVQTHTCAFCDHVEHTTAETWGVEVPFFPRKELNPHDSLEVILDDYFRGTPEVTESCPGEDCEDEDEEVPRSVEKKIEAAPQVLTIKVKNFEDNFKPTLQQIKECTPFDVPTTLDLTPYQVNTNMPLTYTLSTAIAHGGPGDAIELWPEDMEEEEGNERLPGNGDQDDEESEDEDDGMSDESEPDEDELPPQARGTPQLSDESDESEPDDDFDETPTPAPRMRQPREADDSMSDEFSTDEEDDDELPPQAPRKLQPAVADHEGMVVDGGETAEVLDFLEFVEPENYVHVEKGVEPKYPGLPEVAKPGMDTDSDDRSSTLVGDNEEVQEETVGISSDTIAVEETPSRSDRIRSAFLASKNIIKQVLPPPWGLTGLQEVTVPEYIAELGPSSDMLPDAPRSKTKLRKRHEQRALNRSDESSTVDPADSEATIIDATMEPARRALYWSWRKTSAGAQDDDGQAVLNDSGPGFDREALYWSSRKALKAAEDHDGQAAISDSGPGFDREALYWRTRKALEAGEGNDVQARDDDDDLEFEEMMEEVKEMMEETDEGDSEDDSDRASAVDSVVSEMTDEPEDDEDGEDDEGDEDDEEEEEEEEEEEDEDEIPFSFIPSPLGSEPDTYGPYIINVAGPDGINRSPETSIPYHVSDEHWTQHANHNAVEENPQQPTDVCQKEGGYQVVVLTYTRDVLKGQLGKRERLIRGFPQDAL